VTPFLPGDSLLFAVGAIASTGALDPVFAGMLLIAAAILGDAVNYWAGRAIGPRVFQHKTSRFLNRKHLDRTHAFYEKHGGKTIVLARFLPIIRTFAPFVAGIGRMHFPRFLAYNIGGGILWVVLFLGAGYFFGNIPVVKENFSLVIMAIILLSVLPAVAEFVKHRRQRTA
jgi:membrane-associated protein